MNPSRIYLTGFMGCGKSTVGSRIAERLQYAFVDLDAVIERVVGRPVQQIFAGDGEATFRKIEAEQLRWTATLENVVVSVGGGALVTQPNMAFALEHGLVIYLRGAPEMLATRLSRSRTVRPLLLDDEGVRLPPETLLEKVRHMLAEREPSYNRASLIVDIYEQPVSETVEDVLAALSRTGLTPPA